MNLKIALIAPLILTANLAAAEGDMNKRTGFDLFAGFIADNNHAQTVCPKVCNLSFNGGWVTKVDGKTSICNAYDALGRQIKLWSQERAIDVGIDAGPIWGNNEAAGKCNTALSQVSWSGHWGNVGGGDSACSCNGTAYTWRPNVIER